MKHILNNLTEQEKNAIREQHTGGMKVMTENFSKLVSSKLGDSKPLVKEELEMDDIDDEEEEIEKEVRQSFARQHSHSDPDEFTLVGKLQRNRFRQGFRETNYPHFVLRNRNKTEDGTGILGGVGLEDYEDKLVKITGRTKNGKPPSFKNPLILTKRPQVLSR